MTSDRVRRWPLAVLLAVLAFGVLAGALMTWHHEEQLHGDGTAELIGCDESAAVNCDVVNTSEWSEIFAVPLATWATAAYMTLAAVVVLALRGLRGALGILVAAGAAMTLFSGFLYYVASTELGYVCSWCARMYAVNVAIPVLGFLAGRPSRPDRETARLAAIAFVSSSVVAVGAQRLYRAHLVGEDPPALDGKAPALDRDPEGAFVSRRLPATTEAGRPTEITVGWGDAWKGNPAARVVVVTFADFECIYCKRAAAELERLYAAYRDRVLFVFKHYPLDPACNPSVRNRKHPRACDAARAAVCAREQGRFWAFHDLAFANQQHLDPASLRSYVERTGAAVAGFDACLALERSLEAVQRDGTLGRALDIRGTPRIFIDGELHRSGTSAEAMARAIERALGRRSSRLRRRTSRGRGTGPRRSPRPRRGARSLLACLPAVLLVTACARRAERLAPEAVVEAPRIQSNILRSDYVGSEECGLCHAEIYETWRDSPMRNMTRTIEGAHVEATFDGAVFQLGDDTVTMQERDGTRFMRIASAYDGVRLYRVTRVIGGRYREDFVGIDVTDAIDPATARGRGPERVLPVSFVFETRSWRYKGYSVLNPERPGIRVKVDWRKRCIGCHNTLPYFSYLFDDLLGPGAAGYQGTLSDDLLPPSRRSQVLAMDPHGLDASVTAEIELLGGVVPQDAEPSTRELLAAAITTTRRKLAPEHLVEIGIGCESCHGGSAEHADDPSILPSFEPRAAFLGVALASGPARPAQWINRTCLRCHTVLFSSYPFTWEGGRRDDPVPGGSTINSGEARDFLLGGCAEQLACTACHDPHAEDRAESLEALVGPIGNALCAGCHPTLGTPEGLLDHTHHPPGEGSACVACHMPRKNMGLGYDLTRYHRIGSPTDRARVLGDRPLECALCHADQSVEEIVTTMERWWGKRYDRGKLRELYGDDLDVNALLTTIERGKAHEQAAAIGALADHRDTDAVPAIAGQLVNEYPLVRYFARHALETIIGEPVPIDVNLPLTEIAEAVRRWRGDRDAIFSAATIRGILPRRAADGAE